MKSHKNMFKTKKLITRTVIVVAVLTFAFIVPLQSVNNSAYADKYDDQIKALQEDIDKYKVEADKLNSESQSLQKEIGQIENSKAVLQAKIDLSQAQYNKLTKQIKETENKIQDARDALGETIANLYVDSKITPLEMLASSNNVSEFLDRQEYRNSVRDELVGTIGDIKDLKDKLGKQKDDTKKTLADQNKAKSELVAKQTEQRSLLSKTEGQEGAYQQLIGKSQDKQNDLVAQQKAALAAAVGSNVQILPGDPNRGGYPWEGNCNVSGGYSYGGVYYSLLGYYNGLDGMGTDSYGSGAYGCRQCVSYAAWKVYQKTGQRWSGLGDATLWPSRVTNKGHTPRVGSLGVISGGVFGHIAYIESVNSDGTVDVSQYNYGFTGDYSEMRVSSSTFDWYIYF